MNTPLHAKIMLVLEESERLTRHEAAKRIEEFMLSQINLRTLPHFLTIADLNMIKQYAVRNFLELNTRSFKVEGRLVAKDDDMARTISYIDSITGVLWNLGLLSAPIKFK